MKPGTFYSCTNLAVINIPSGVTNIGDSAFAGCSSLKAVCFRGDAPATDAYTFFGCSLAKAYYLSGASGFGAAFGGIPQALWPQFADVSMAAGSIVINTEGTDGEVYVLQVSTSLSGAIWAPLATNTVSGGSGDFNIPVSNDGAHFYRVVIEL